MREREEWERLEMERKAKPRTGAVSEAYLVPGSRPGKGDGWVEWMDGCGWEWGHLGGRGKGKQMGSSFRATVPGPSGPREPQKVTVFWGPPLGLVRGLRRMAVWHLTI